MSEMWTKSVNIGQMIDQWINFYITYKVYKFSEGK